MMFTQKIQKIFLAYGAAFILLVVANCTSGLIGNDSPEVKKKDGRSIIVDNTGKEWDVTHAVEKYDMKAERFQFGLGPFAIRPIQKPTFLNPGEAGYPDAGDGFLVIGYAAAGDVRAYPIDVLTRHEIADDKFGTSHVAVAY